MGDVEDVIGLAKGFENLLEERYGAAGDGLGEKTRSVSSRLDQETIAALGILASERNRLAHDHYYVSVQDRHRLSDALAVLNSKVYSGHSLNGPLRNQIASFEDRLAGNDEKWVTVAERSWGIFESTSDLRIVVIRHGAASVAPIGRLTVPFWRAPFVRITRVAMLPRFITIRPRNLRSKDNIAMTGSLSAQVRVKESDGAIGAVALHEQHLKSNLDETITGALSRQCASRSYSGLIGMSQEIEQQAHIELTGLAAAMVGFEVVGLQLTVLEASHHDLASVPTMEQTMLAEGERVGLEAKLTRAKLGAALERRTEELAFELHQERERDALGEARERRRIAVAHEMAALLRTDGGLAAVDLDKYYANEIAKIQFNFEAEKLHREELDAVYRHVIEILKETAGNSRLIELLTQFVSHGAGGGQHNVNIGLDRPGGHGSP